MMLRNRYLIIAVGVLLIIVIAYNIRFFLSKKDTSHVPVVKSAEPVKAPEMDAKMAARILEHEDKDSWKRDPFAMQSAAVKADYGKGMRLTGIIKRDGRSHALINGKVYGVNDRVGDFVIKEIKKDGIILAGNGKTEEISFNDYKVLKEKKK